MSDHRRRNVAKIVKEREAITSEVIQRRRVGLVPWTLVLVEVVNMTKEVYPRLRACLLAVNGLNTLVHLGKDTIITVSVKCHSGKSLGSGTHGGCHPKIHHIQQEAVSKLFLFCLYFLINFSLVHSFLFSKAPYIITLILRVEFRLGHCANVILIVKVSHSYGVTSTWTWPSRNLVSSYLLQMTCILKNIRQYKLRFV